MNNLQKEFSRLYDQCIGRIYRFVFLRVNSREAAQDIVSEAFSRTWERFRERDSDNRVQNWIAFLYRVAKNLVVDFYREKSRLQIISASAVSEPLVEFNLEQEAALSLEIEKIRKVLSRLGEEQQEVIIWHYLDGLSHKEIAAILDKPEGTVRVIVHRALEALRKELKCA